MTEFDFIKFRCSNFDEKCIFEVFYKKATNLWNSLEFLWKHLPLSIGAGLGLEEALPIPPHPTAQVSGLAWHPLQKLLVIGWENGEIYFYNHDENKCSRIEADARWFQITKIC